MAVRRNLAHSALVRERIQTTQLINRLTDHAFGRVEMSATQVAAALGVLKKSLPDLAAVEYSGEVVQAHYVVEVPQAAVSVDAWLREIESASGPGSSSGVPLLSRNCDS